MERGCTSAEVVVMTAEVNGGDGGVGCMVAAATAEVNETSPT